MKLNKTIALILFEFLLIIILCVYIVFIKRDFNNTSLAKEIFINNSNNLVLVLYRQKPGYVDKVYTKHTIQEGDTISSISQRYAISSDCILKANNLEYSPNLSVGEELYIPTIDEDAKIFQDGKLVYDSCALFTGEKNDDFVISDPRTVVPFLQLPFLDANFKVARCYRAYHQGIDFVLPNDKSVVAPAEGTVVYVGYDPVGMKYDSEISSSKTGLSIVIRHANSMFTSYLHLEEVYVMESEKVEQNDLIAVAGSSGNASGEHLHFALSSRPQIFQSFVNPSYFFVDGIDDKCGSVDGLTYDEYMKRLIY